MTLGLVGESCWTRVEGALSASEAQADLILLLSVALPPAALDVLGPLVAERRVETAYGAVGPIGLRAAAGRPPVWVAPYSGGPRRTDPRATILAAAQLGVRQLLAWDAGIARATSDWRAARWRWWRTTSTGAGAARIRFTSAETSVEQIANLAYRPAFCPRMRRALLDALPDAEEVVYLAVDGPRRETEAEARMFRAWGADVIGQNLSPEVALAQEAGFCYAGLVTIAELAADQERARPHGEVRASLGAALAALPDIIERVNAAEGECGCGAMIG